MIADNLVEAIAANSSVQAFKVRVLPWRSRSLNDFLDAHVLDAILEVLSIDTIAIANHVSRCRVIEKRFDDLLRRPNGGWIRRDVEMDDCATVMTEDDKAEQDAKRRGRHREEVDRDDVGQVIVQEGTPGLRRWLLSSNPVLPVVASDTT